jgi:NodT family efflux transporter outer membrane factor (OMF) lipoprotein
MPKPLSHPLRPAALLPLAFVAGCTVGPDYAGPPPIATASTAPAGFARAEGVADAGAPAPLARWWTAFNDPTLDALIARALDRNPDLDAARARVRQARAQVRQERAQLLPSINALGAYAHARVPGLDLGQADTSGPDQPVTAGENSTSNFDFFNAGFDASWEVDLFGVRRRAIEAARASADTADAGVDDARLTLTAEIANAYVALRDRQRRLGLAQRSVAAQERMLALTEQRQAQGTASDLETVRLRAALDSTRADVTPLNAEIDSYLNALAVLTGDVPGTLDATLRAPAPLPLPPAQIAVGDPAALIRNRPDIRSAERTLAADTARIGQAEAARFPRVSFMGIIGLGGSSASDLTDLDNFTLIAAPQIQWSFLDFGRTRARVVQSEAVRDEAEARYRATVLAALRDAEDSLSRFKYRRATVATLARSKAAADRALLLSEQRYRAGTSTLIDLLDAQRQQISAEQGLSQAEAALTADFVAIQKALGLGWQREG